MKFSRPWPILLLLTVVCSAAVAAPAAQMVTDPPAATGVPESSSAASAAPSEEGSWVNLPGPLHSAMRMAAISQEAAPSDVIPLLARNISSKGYHRLEERSTGHGVPPAAASLLRASGATGGTGGQKSRDSGQQLREAKPLLQAIGVPSEAGVRGPRKFPGDGRPGTSISYGGFRVSAYRPGRSSSRRGAVFLRI